MSSKQYGIRIRHSSQPNPKKGLLLSLKMGSNPLRSAYMLLAIVLMALMIPHFIIDITGSNSEKSI